VAIKLEEMRADSLFNKNQAPVVSERFASQCNSIVSPEKAGMEIFNFAKEFFQLLLI